MSHEVFISYASEDKTVADAVCAILEANRIRCWIAPRDVLPAEDYGAAIVRSLSASRLLVLVFSANANASPHVRRELEGAVRHGIPILPFRIEDAVPSDSLQYYLGGTHWLDALTPPLEAHLQHLAGTVQVLLERDELRVELPTVDAGRAWGPHARVIGLGVLVLVVAGIAVAVALALGGGGTNDGDRGGGGKYLARAERSCALVDRDDLETVYGTRPDPGKPDGRSGVCDFGLGFPAVAVNQVGVTQADYDFERPYAPAAAVDVPGVGGGAFVEPGQGLTVFDPERHIIFQLLFRDSSAEGTRQLAELARLTLARA